MSPVVPEGWVAVPKSALAWLFGEAPDESGRWFGDFAEGEKPRGEFWWRSVFRRMLAVSPAKTSPTEGDREKASNIVEAVDWDAGGVFEIRRPGHLKFPVRTKLREAIATALAAERAEATERAARIVRQWLSAGYLKLHAGEMSAQEVRSVKAVLGAIILEIGDAASAIRSLNKEDGRGS